MNLKIKYIFLLLCSCMTSSAQYTSEGMVKLNWRLSCQAYTFREFTLVETLNKLNTLGIEYIEIYPNQTIGGNIEGTTTYQMDKQKRQQLKELLKVHGITPLSYGVVSPEKEEEWKDLFEFAKEMCISMLISEPAYHLLDLVEELADQYKIKVAIHNHAAPTRYWDPEIMLSRLKGRSSNLGVCADIGHFVRSGIASTEAVKQLRNRIICLHMKDVNQYGIRVAHDMPWGTGYCDIPQVLRIMEEMGVKSNIFFTIEYEYNWHHSLPEIRESIDYFYRITHWMTANY
ncbi:MAG: sugar phosphate isomerase/epimerase [Tannerellaceae bacterium]|nr:sugar phosphate isomerase/epimerase [Tannerellaceae bacterium]